MFHLKIDNEYIVGVVTDHFVRNNYAIRLSEASFTHLIQGAVVDIEFIVPIDNVLSLFLWVAHVKL